MEPNIYEFSTSPRKLEPELNPKRHKQRRKLRVIEDLPRQEIKISKAQKRKQTKLTLIVIAIFALLLTISYRNSQINEKLASLQKENEQLKVNIANGLNLNNIEKIAKEKLGMQKLTNKQTLYVSLPKKDYVESASEKVVIEKEKNWFENFVNKIFNK